ncbi:MAG: hypothetical protein AAFN70_04520 [Planctomycetota bacterium]
MARANKENDHSGQTVAGQDATRQDVADHHESNRSQRCQQATSVPARIGAALGVVSSLALLYGIGARNLVVLAIVGIAGAVLGRMTAEAFFGRQNIYAQTMSSTTSSAISDTNGGDGNRIEPSTVEESS